MDCDINRSAAAHGGRVRGGLIYIPADAIESISLSHGRYFRQFWGTATFTSESLHTARCNSLYL